jgi:hypothetical protein
VSLAWRQATAVRSGQTTPAVYTGRGPPERPETIRADIAGDDQEIARRHVGQEPVLIAEGNNSHADRRRQFRIVA